MMRSNVSREHPLKYEQTVFRQSIRSCSGDMMCSQRLVGGLVKLSRRWVVRAVGERHFLAHSASIAALRAGRKGR